MDQARMAGVLGGHEHLVLLRGVEEVGLPTRVANILRGEGNIYLVADLLEVTEEQLRALRNFGPSALRDVKRVLSDLGLDLGEGLDPGLKARVARARHMHWG